MRLLWLVAATLLIAGCSSKPPTPDASTAVPTDSTAPSLAPVSVPLHFASGDYEALTGFEATFAATDTCLPECSASAEQSFDLTPYIPADAPVELTITIDHDGSVDSQLEFEDATPVRQDREGGGQGRGGANQISALVTRASSGSISLVLRHGFINPGSPNGVTANVEVRSVVRSDVLVPGIPAALRLSPGDTLNFSSTDLDQAVLITSMGTVRDLDTPFTLQVPQGAVGDSIVMVAGDSTQVLGPNVTMAARRVVQEVVAPKDLAAGETTLSIDAATSPLVIGVVIESKDVVAFLGGASFIGAFTVTITSPANVEVLNEECTGAGGGFFPMCSFSLIGGSTTVMETPFLSEYLVAGTYQIAISTQQTNGFQAYAYQVQII